MLRMISDTVLVGTRTESAMKPTCLISGRTCSSALPAPVEERMILFIMERFFRRSEAAAFGGASSTFWVLVAAWMVDIDAVRICEVSRVSRSGLIRCARPVVVQDADERTWCLAGSKEVWLMP